MQAIRMVHFTFTISHYALSTVSESVHIFVSAFHESFVYVAEPPRMQHRSCQSYRYHRNGSHLVVEALHQRIHHQHGQEQGRTRHQHLHLRVSSRFGQFLVQVDSGIVVHSQLEDEGENGTRGEKKTSQCGHRGDFP